MKWGFPSKVLIMALSENKIDVARGWPRLILAYKTPINTASVIKLQTTCTDSTTAIKVQLWKVTKPSPGTPYPIVAWVSNAKKKGFQKVRKLQSTALGSKKVDQSKHPCGADVHGSKPENDLPSGVVHKRVEVIELAYSGSQGMGPKTPHREPAMRLQKRCSAVQNPVHVALGIDKLRHRGCPYASAEQKAGPVTHGDTATWNLRSSLLHPRLGRLSRRVGARRQGRDCGPMPVPLHGYQRTPGAQA
mmetsp:Transcript_4069/g.9872  ORF Transcript_4069/g.9872 Transcript_4069/m.9872 type:complete len:247 (+) Transcript_4069:573-1313(+)